MNTLFAYSVVLGSAAVTQIYVSYHDTNKLVAHCGSYYDYFYLIPDHIRNILGTSKDVVVTTPMTPFECYDLNNKVAIFLGSALYEGLASVTFVIFGLSQARLGG